MYLDIGHIQLHMYQQQRTVKGNGEIWGNKVLSNG
jgi:hypothetical protein